MKATRTLLALPLVLLAVGCSDAPTAPDDVSPQFARSANAPVHKASGGGHLDISLFGDLPNEQYGFTASVDANGNAKGQVHADFSLPDVTFHGSVECLSVQGNEAWIGISVTQATGIYAPGTRLVFKVRDNGQGVDAAADEMSFFFGWGGGSCDFHFFNPLMLPWATGNIQVS